ncbi:unnamed protein product [Orchesella dallaii]|uniref:CRAL-TRIO domain-containing protein n=1 Tax=Orchesella dallaii TaxID=48710 RepID=A0ABP1S6M2_9HEXA
MLILPEETISLEKFKETVNDLNQDDGVLIRFLRARDYDIDNAEQMLRLAVQWRKEMDLDNLHLKKWNFPPHFYTSIKYRYFGRDYEGAPRVEQGLQQTIDCGSPGNVVIDLEGLSYSQATHIPTLKFAYLAFQTIEQCFPEILKAVYIINVPWIFSFAFNFFQPVIAQRTLAKTKVFNRKEEWHVECLKRFPRDSIVPELQPPMDIN